MDKLLLFHLSDLFLSVVFSPGSSKQLSAIDDLAPVFSFQFKFKFLFKFICIALNHSHLEGLCRENDHSHYGCHAEK